MTPWDPLHPIAYIALRASDDEARQDGLADNVDPALNLGESFTVRVFTIAGVSDGMVDVLAGAGPMQSVTGPIPEPATLAMLAVGALLLLRRRRMVGAQPCPSVSRLA